MEKIIYRIPLKSVEGNSFFLSLLPQLLLGDINASELCAAIKASLELIRPLRPSPKVVADISALQSANEEETNGFSASRKAS